MGGVASVGMMAAVLNAKEEELLGRVETEVREEIKTVEEVRRAIDTALIEEAKLRFTGLIIGEKL